MRSLSKHRFRDFAEFISFYEGLKCESLKIKTYMDSLPPDFKEYLEGSMAYFVLETSRARLSSLMLGEDIESLLEWWDDTGGGTYEHVIDTNVIEEVDIRTEDTLLCFIQGAYFSDME